MSRRRRSKLAKKYKKNPDFTGKAKRKAKKHRRGARFVGAPRPFGRRRAGKRRIVHELSHPRSNPSSIDWADLGITVGYGFGGFALSRFATRVTSVQVAKRWPSAAKHAGVAAGLVTFLAALFFAKKSRHTAAQAETLQIGTGVALAQTVIQTYFPKLGWVVADCTNDQVAQAAAAQQVAAPTSTGLLDDEDEDNDSVWGGYNDAYDHGRHARSAQPRQSAAPRPQAPPAAQATRTATHATGPATDDDDVDSILAELDDDNLGVFGAN
jgi:hypothetical protein